MTRATDLATPEGQALFFSRVEKTEGCWLWIGKLFESSGYGRFKAQGRETSAHIFSWEMVHGPVRAGLELDHLCRVRRCVKPDHLEPVTHRENEVRGETVIAANANRTACVNGHPLSGENLFIKKNGTRHCRICHRARGRKSRTSPEYRAYHAAYERRRRAMKKETANVVSAAG